MQCGSPANNHHPCHLQSSASSSTASPDMEKKALQAKPKSQEIGTSGCSSMSVRHLKAPFLGEKTETDSNANEVISEVDAADYEVVNMAETNGGNSTPRDPDGVAAVETSSNCSMEETCAKIEDALKKNLKMWDLEKNGQTQLDKSEVVHLGWWLSAWHP